MDQSLTIVNNTPEYNYNIKKNRCCARLANNLNKQCSYSAKKDGLCGIHLKKGKHKITTIYDNLILTDRKCKTIQKTIKINSNKLNHLINIQSKCRNFIVNWRLYYRGPACYSRSLCNNDTDCTTFENIDTIPINEFFSYKDNNGLYWGFNIATFKELLKYSNTNPYNTNEIDSSVIIKFQELLKLTEKSKKISITKTKITDPKIKLQQKCIEIFQIMDNLKQYTQCSWFMNLNLAELKELFKQLEDIWNYRTGLTQEDKLRYVKEGKLFTESMTVINNSTSTINLANIILDNCKRLVTEGKSVEDRTTGALWILSGLTIVSYEARIALPWLFQSANVY